MLAQQEREAELYCYEHDIPPRGRDTVLVSTSHRSGVRKLLGLTLSRDDVRELPTAGVGRFYAEVKRTLETRFYD